MKVQEIMERTGISGTGRAIAYIKDALEDMNQISETHVDVVRMDINQNQRFYKIPTAGIKLIDVRCKNHLNGNSEYRSIPRIVYEPGLADSDGQ